MSEKELKYNKTDLLASSSKSILGAIPFAGSFLSELVGNLIPNQRIDRLTKYIKKLENKLSDIDNKKIKNLLKDEECVDLFEEGFIQATRALNDERREQIASVIRNGLDDDSIKYSESKYVLKILQELNDHEVIWLRFFLSPTIGGDKEFREKHKNVLKPVHAFIGADEEIIKKDTLQKSYKEHLERLGLIHFHYRIDKETGDPKYSKTTGRPSISFTDITFLGRLVLKQIGLLSHDEKK